MVQYISNKHMKGDNHKPRGQLRGRGLTKRPFYYISNKQFIAKSDHEGGGGLKIAKFLITWFMDDP